MLAFVIKTLKATRFKIQTPKNTDSLPAKKNRGVYPTGKPKGKRRLTQHHPVQLAKDLPRMGTKNAKKNIPIHCIAENNMRPVAVENCPTASHNCSHIYPHKVKGSASPTGRLTSGSAFCDGVIRIIPPLE